MEAKGGEASSKKHALVVKEKNLANVVFKWSLDDILNKDLYKDKVGKFPNSFESVEHYRSSFVYPLLEEIRSEICSKMGSISTAPFSKVISLHQSEKFRKLCYDVMVEDWKHSSDSVDKEPYRTKQGDIIAFTEATPGQYLDLQSLGRSWNVGYVTRLLGDNRMYGCFEVKTSKELVCEQNAMKKLLYAVFVTNVTTNNRVCKALSLNRNLDIIKEILGNNSMVQERCKLCPSGMKEMLEEELCLPSYLNKSQHEAVVECIFTTQCDHKPSVELVWGPPGTGKTGTLSVMLKSLLQLKCRTLICCPTNVAISEVASRVMKLVKDDGTLLCSLGDILLYGNIDQTAYYIEEIYLNYRVERLYECLADGTGWKQCINTMIELLDNCVSMYNDFCNSKSVKDGNKYVNDQDSFLKFIRDRFVATASSLRNCISNICIHLPKTFIMEPNFEAMVELMSLLDSFETFLLQANLVGEELKKAFLLQGQFNSSPHVDVNISTFLHIRSKCLEFLRNLLCALDGLKLPIANKDLIEEFCFKMASLIFCTASSSYKLNSVKMQPFKLLVVDEAAQLRECELLIPLQVLGMKHAILLGDECQLPAYVSSKVSAEAGLGKSLFERLSILGFSRHLLDTQYRMHPKISTFPNARFYQNRIMDAENVRSDSYGKRYLPGPMYGTYSFMNISSGREVIDDGHSLKNMVEVAVVLKILQLLYRACEAQKVKVTVGIVSPYSAQVSEIQRKLGQKYDNNDEFKVHIRSIDGFQGSEEDIIIISTVRCNRRGSIGFTSSPHRTNVALTRARHCLWILGNEETLSNSDSIWEQLVLDAKVRQCFFNIEDDKDLQKVIMEVKKQLDQLSDMLNADSMLFRNSRWKLMFSGNFTKSFKKLESVETKNLVLFFLSKLANGWRPKRVDSVISCGSSSKILKQYKIGKYYILCSVDIYKELWYMQTLKVWDILTMQDIPRMIKRLDNVFRMYTEDYISRCNKKCVEGNLEVPMTWAASEDIVQYKSLCNTETGESSNTGCLDESNLEKSKVRESLLLMKFYSLSCGAVSNLLSSCDGDSLTLPFELTDQERDRVLCNKSSFILGRSGTGKTTVLTWKLFQNDQLYHVASEGYHEVRSDPSVNERRRCESGDGIKEDVLRQLFVTVSPKLCYAVRDQFSQLKRSVCGGDSLPQGSSIHVDVVDEVAQSADIPDSFYDLPRKMYPLIITFHKFMMMLDGTLGVSYFDRFPVLRQPNHRGTGKSRSITLENFIRTKEVTFERFKSFYWPHFNKDLTRKLCSLTVFTEIMSVIKGGLSTKGNDAGTLNQQEYISLANNRGSTLNMEKRLHVYKIFTDYEKRKVANGDFDLADLVIDLHRRLKDIQYKGEEMDFVFIDEVQDLSMRQISLFKYICKNVDEGFAFSGDTAQSIAKGINFRFEDVRYLFYKEFLGPERNSSSKRNEKVKISSLFHLNLNFRTHAGILKLAQSVINLICHFFPSSIDNLNQETSLVSGEAPVLLETGSMDALRIIFENSEKVDKNVISFGAEQVILVRDDCLKKEICDFVGKKALVLTILECKGLEFQDVLLYNFFTSSPFENEWRVIYEYMNDNLLLDSTTSTSFPRFNMEKHGILCSELKQLYVAVTRTRQRLWICENGKAFCGPMFNYWKKLGAAHVKKLDDLFIKEMQVKSSEEDWSSRGIKLFHENNYEMAMMCFERAGDTYWVKLSEASLCQAAARAREPNSEMTRTYLRKAAEIFDEIGKAESAARLFFEIDEYERAGCIYLYTLREPNLEKAGECFCLAKCFRQAAKVYANGRLYSKCLSACLHGKLFEMGLQYVHDWTQSGVLHGSNRVEIDRIVQEFLHNGAVHYYEKNEFRKMMKFVESFQSKDLIRNFLKDLKLLRELLDLEISWGNFLAAARIAKKMGNCLLEADLLSKCGIYQEASLLMLWYVFSSLTRSKRGNYGPSYHFNSMDEILKKAMSIAKRHSDGFYEFVCMEARFLSEAGAVEELESGLRFVQHWRQDVPDGLVKTSSELAKIEQDFLERCALHHYDLKDSKTMMKFVEDFQSFDLVHAFLNRLMLLEEKKGNFFEAAAIAELKGDVLRKSDILLKGGYFKEASQLILWYVFAKSIWAHGSGGWPMRQFAQKEELLEKAKRSAKKHSDSFYMFVCTEANMMSNQEISLSDLGQYLFTSVHRSLRGEILASRRVLDVHINSLLAYEWNGEVLNNLTNHVEDKISQNQVSLETLCFIWNYWRGKILKLIQFLCCEPGQNVGEYSDLEDYILNYFGVRKDYHNHQMVYVVDSSTEWVGEIDSTLLSRPGDSVCIALPNFVTAALSHLSSGLFSVGVEVLVSLKLLSTQCRNTSVPVFCQCLCLVYMFEIAKFLADYKFPNFKYTGNRTVQSYLKLSSGDFFDEVFHIDYKVSFSKELILLRGKESSLKLLKEATMEPLYVTNASTAQQMGRLVTVILGSCKQTLHLDNNLMKSFDLNQTWLDFIEIFSSDERSEIFSDSGPSDAASIEVFVAYSIFALLKDKFCADCSPLHDFISPQCFLYLAERLLVMVSYFKGHLFVTKSSCVEWLIYEGWNVQLSPMEMPLVLGDVHNVLAFQIETLLLNKHDTLLWIRSSFNNSEEYYRLLVLRLIVLLCLICVNSGQHFDKLFSLLDKNEISTELPMEFCDALKRSNCYFIEALADAFVRIENPLVIVSSMENFAECPCSNVIFLNIEKLSGNDLINELFSDTCDTRTSHDHIEGGDLGKPYGLFWEIFSELVSLDEETGSLIQFMSTAPLIKVEVEKIASLLSHTIAFSVEESWCKNDDLMEANVMVDELDQLSYALDIRNLHEENIQTVVKISKGLQSRRLKMEPFFDNLFMQMHQHSMHP